MGKTYSVIRGRRKSNNEWADQAYRYPKSRWSASEARGHCRRHEGRFEAASNQNIQFIGNCIVNVETRRASHEGRDYLIAPVVALVEGVHNGLLYTDQELSRFVEAWNGIPLMVHHPEEDGTPISANYPAVIEQQSVGRFWNVHCEKGKLKGEIWIDVEKANKVNPGILQDIHNRMEVSTGLWGDEDDLEGVWNGEEYRSTIRNLRPDHLALLPGEVGACSWQDGCGVRANKNGGETMKDNLRTSDANVTIPEEAKAWAQEPLDKTIVDARASGIKDLILNLARRVGIKTQDVSHEELRAELQAVVDTLDGPYGGHFVKKVYENYVVFERRPNAPGQQSALLKQGWKRNNEGRVELTGEAEQVREETEYVRVGERQANDDNEKTTTEEEATMLTKEQQKQHKEMVDTLIANDRTPFTEEDRDYLEGLEAPCLENVQKTVEKYGEVLKASKEESAMNAKEESTNSPDKDKTGNEPPKENQETPKSLEDYIADAPAEFQEVIENGVNLHKRQKTELVQALTSNKQCQFSKEELEGKKVDELQKLAALAQVKINYSGKGGAKTEEAAQITLLERPKLEVASNDK